MNRPPSLTRNPYYHLGHCTDENGNYVHDSRYCVMCYKYSCPDCGVRSNSLYGGNDQCTWYCWFMNTVVYRFFNKIQFNDI